MSHAVEQTNRRMLRARDAMDRACAQPLDVAALARTAHVSPAHFARTFRATFGETPHRYPQRRRVERAMSLLRETDRSVTDICVEFTDEPTERPYGIDCGLRDPFGNSVRFTQLTSS